MNHSLDHELMPLPFTKRQHTYHAPHNHQLYLNNFKASDSFRQLKQRLVISMCLLFMLYRQLWHIGVDSCIRDLGHQWTQSLNRLINQDELFYQIVIIITQQSIEINILCMCLFCTWKVKNLRTHLFIALFYGIRGILLNIERFPYPPYIRWDAPVVPSFTVPYGITRDYFYSGHTGLMLFSTFFWKRLGIMWLYYPNLVLTPFVIMMLLSTRVHYSIDIIAAVIFTLWLERHISRHVFWFDRLWTFILELLDGLVIKIKGIFQ